MSDDMGAAGPVPDGPDADEWDPFTDGDPDLGTGDVGVFGLDREEAEVVRAANGEVREIDVPATFSPTAWRRALTVYHQFYDQNGRLPSPRDAYKAWPKIPLDTYREFAAHDEFARALSLRGVEAEFGNILMDIQHLAIMKLTDPSDRRTDRAKLSQLGISWPRYQGWLKNPVFAKEKRRKTEEMFADVQDTALVKLRGNIEAGEQRAIEFGLAVTGRYNPATMAVQDARSVILLVIESIVKNVEDPKVRAAILSDVQAAAVGFDLTNRPALEG